MNRFKRSADGEQWRTSAVKHRRRERRNCQELTLGKGEALVREPEELKSLCIEYSREPSGYSPNEDFAEGEADEKRKDRKFRGRAFSLDRLE